MPLNGVVLRVSKSNVVCRRIKHLNSLYLYIDFRYINPILVNRIFNSYEQNKRGTGRKRHQANLAS